MRQTSRPAVQPLLRRALAGAKILSAARERELLVRYHENEDKAAMDELVRSHMPIIFRVAGRSAQNPGVDINDLVQTATEGLLIAINRWSFEKSDASGARYAESLLDSDQPAIADPPSAEATQAITATAEPAVPRSSRLATYAMWWMRILLTDTVIENRGMVVRAKSPKIRKALFSLPTAIRKLDITLPLAGSDVTRIAVYLGIREQDIEEALIHAAGDVMLDEPVGEGNLLRGDILPDANAEGEDGILSRLASKDRWGAVCQALCDLAPRDRFILITRYLLLPKWRLDRLSECLKMSRERIRQIGDDSLARIRRSVTMAGVSHVAGSEKAVEQIEALANAVEAASASADPTALPRLLAEQDIAIGSTRGAGRPATARPATPARRAMTTPAVQERSFA